MQWPPETLGQLQIPTCQPSKRAPLLLSFDYAWVHAELPQRRASVPLLQLPSSVPEPKGLFTRSFIVKLCGVKDDMDFTRHGLKLGARPWPSGVGPLGVCRQVDVDLNVLGAAVPTS